LGYILSHGNSNKMLQWIKHNKMPPPDLLKKYPFAA